MERAELKAWLRATGCAEERGDLVFLTDPHWGAAERAQVEAWQAKDEDAAAGMGDEAGGWLCVPTGGTSGGASTTMVADSSVKAVSAPISDGGLPDVRSPSARSLLASSPSASSSLAMGSVRAIPSSAARIRARSSSWAAENGGASGSVSAAIGFDGGMTDSAGWWAASAMTSSA